MRYSVLACDYDGTIAVGGHVSPDVVDALRSLRRSGRRLVLVTGRILDDLFKVFPHVGLLDRVVAENGAVLFRPASGETRLLADPPPELLEKTLRARGVQPLSTGRVIVAAAAPFEKEIRAALRALELDFQLIFNKDSVMVLPRGVTKATGLAAALREVDVPSDAVVGVGDAENDADFLEACGYAVAVGDALPAIRARADHVLRGGAGAGVIELVGRLLADDP